ncbi:MAG: glycosyltransferase [Clostridia bacterium]|nr:glycosyltransferase [Clostridia bacterium]
MSTYNGEKYIKKQIDSILSQKGNFKLSLVVRDDGSKDNTINILDEYKKKGKLLWYKGKNLKPARSFIELVFMVEPEFDYYLFSDQDDYWFDNKVQSAINKIDDRVPCIYYSNPELVDENLKSLGRKVYKSVPSNNFESVICGVNAIGCTILFNNSLLGIIRKYKKPNVVEMHDSYICKVCVSVGGKIIYDDNAYMKYRQHSNNVIGVKTGLVKKVIKFFKDIFQKRSISISEQAEEILRLYSNEICPYNQDFLKKVSEYKTHFFNKLSLAFSPKLKYSSLRMKIMIRLAILNGSR